MVGMITWWAMEGVKGGVAEGPCGFFCSSKYVKQDMVNHQKLVKQD